jgi:membrane protease YdiL (CAAX protease family)
MAVWGPDAPVRDAVAGEAAASPSVPRPAERWIDIALVPLIASGLPLLVVALAAVARPDFRESLGIGIFSNYALYAAMAGFYLSVLAAIAFLLLLRGRRIGEVFFAKGGRVWTFAAIPAGISMALGAGGFLMLLPEAMQQEMMEMDAVLKPGSLGEALCLLFVVVLLAPLAEEIYFRGIMLRVFGRHFSFPVSTAATAIVFTLVHGHLFPVPGPSGFVLTAIIFVLGVLLALFARAGGNLRAPFAMHAAYNATLMLPGVYTLLFAQG